MTPIANAVSAEDETYNVAHRKARNCVERCIGVLKGRFRILGKDRILRYTPQRAGLIINVCAVLHNILVKSKVPIDEGQIEDIDEEPENNGEENEPYEIERETLLQRGVSVRQSVVEEFFRQ